MKTIKILLLTGIIFCLNISCEKMLEEDPRSLVVPDKFFNSTDEIMQAVNGVYSYLSTVDLYQQSQYNLGDCVTDMAVSRDDLQLQYSYREYGPVDKDLVSVWSTLYAAINAANSTITGIKNSSVKQEVKDPLLAEVYYLRGLYYFILTNFWGDVPLWTDDVKNVEEIGALPRTPVKEVFAQIIADLTYAEGILPVSYTGSVKSRATKGSAQALMTRVYLFDKNWQKSIEKAQQLISSSTYKLSDNYGDIFLEKNERSNPEIIFTTEFKSLVKGTMRHAMYGPRFDREGVADFQGYGSIIPSKLLISSLADDDLRKSQLVMSEWKGQKFKRIYWGPKFHDIGAAPTQSGKDFIIIRYAEVLLSLAEAENELNGPTEIAYGAINQVRKRAGLKELSELTKETFRDALIRERGIELVGEGLRRWDLNRWGILVKAIQAMDRADNAWAPDNVRDYMQLCKLPSAELIKNPKLTQNPGYN